MMLSLPRLRPAEPDRKAAEGRVPNAISARPSNGLGFLVRFEGGQATVAPAHAHGHLVRRERVRPLCKNSIELRAGIDRRIGRAQAAEACAVARAIIWNAA